MNLQQKYSVTVADALRSVGRFTRSLRMIDKRVNLLLLGHALFAGLQ